MIPSDGHSKVRRVSNGSEKLRYVGPHAEVEVEGPDGTIYIVEREDVHEFPAALAESLKEQPANWRPLDVKVSAKAAELAEAEGVNVNDLSGSGAGGSITVDDVRAAIAERESAGEDEVSEDPDNEPDAGEED